VALTVGSLGWSTGSWLQGRPSLPISRPRLITVGIGLLVVATAGATLATAPEVSGWLVVPAWIVAGIGMGIAMSSLNVLVMDLSSAGEQGVNTAAMTVCDTLGTSLATGLCGAIVAACGMAHLAAGLAAGGVLMTLLGVLAVLGTFRLTARVPDVVSE
jgi:MFS family permease